MNFKPLLAEFIGTFTLVFIGVGAIAVDQMTGGSSGLVGIALAHGLAIAVMVAALGAISGGHFNPAVTFGVWVAKKIKSKDVIGYVVAQCLGGVVAAALIQWAIPSSVLMEVSMGTPAINTAAGVTPWMGVIVEMVLTFFLVLVIFGSAIDPRAPKMGGLFIGLTITLDILMGGPISGAAMNPARHLGPALLGGGLDHTWIYWVGPLLGSGLAGVTYSKFFEQR